MAKKQKQQEDKQDNEAVRNENAKPDGGKLDATEANNNNEETTKMKKREKRPKRQRQPKEEEKADEAFEIEDEELTKVMNGAIGGDKTDSDDDDDDSLHMSQDEFDEADLDKKDKRKQKKRRLDEQEIEEQETDAPTTDDANDTTKQNPFALGKSFGTILAKILDEQVGGSTPVLAKFNVKESLIMKEKELRRQENAKRIISLAVKEKGLVKPDFTTLNFERQLAKIARLGGKFAPCKAAPAPISFNAMLLTHVNNLGCLFFLHHGMYTIIVVKLFNAVTKAKLALRAQQNAAAESSSDEDEGKTIKAHA
eukprot:GEZU01023815.1.p1 GENE.GEZU01023815.1~~GEZU01023815.1.p1  ORF type:complete len:319 (-),score=89.26 GEZU01023815.1:456-1385(-)